MSLGRNCGDFLTFCWMGVIVSRERRLLEGTLLLTLGKFCYLDKLSLIKQERLMGLLKPELAAIILFDAILVPNPP
tara:strand:- start:544 stop:771 length:228 start_codon:yes stop_codon:yes gene_type:complete